MFDHVAKKKRVFVAGHRGMVGSAIVRQLSRNSLISVVVAERRELDLISQKQTNDFFKSQHFDEIYLAAARVGGIHANNEYPADFIYENIMIQANLINAAHLADVDQLLFLGSSCIYPKFAEQPMDESSLLTGLLEPTNEPYAIAKIAGIKLCESYNRQYGRDYRSVMPTNLYGEGDNFHPENSHVIPGLIRRFHEAKLNKDESVIAWGTGAPMREFLHVDDMASACLHVMSLDSEFLLNNTHQMTSHINIGTGVDVTIRELTETIADVVGFKGYIKWDVSKPDGTARKLLNVKLIEKLGWQSTVTLRSGLERTYDWFLNQTDYRS